MPEDLKRLTIFISCPGDLGPEKKIIQQAALELSEELEGRFGVQLKVLTWEKDVVPGVGTGTQEVINPQVEGAYDIYIGLLGTKFGTPTQRYGSGTEEEFRAAYELYSSHPEQIRLLFYFKTSADNIFNIELDQLKRVNDFRENIKATVLYGTFSNPDELLKTIRQHLKNLVATQWNDDKWAVLSPADNSLQLHTAEHVMIQSGLTLTEPAEHLPEEDKLGFLELVTAGLEIGSKTTSLFNEMSATSIKLQAQLSKHVLAIQAAQAIGDTKAQISAYDQLADTMLAYEQEFRAIAPQITDALNTTLQNYVELQALIINEMPNVQDEFEDAFNSFSQLVVNLRQGRDGISTIRDSFNSMPPYTRKLRRAMATTSATFDQYIATMTLRINDFERVLSS